jgi:hypothetical protein
MRYVALGLVALATWACKKKEEPPPTAAAPVALPQAPAAPTSPAAQGAAPTPPAPVDPKNPFAALAQLGKALGQATSSPGGTVINWRSLQAFLPEKLGSWAAQGEVSGATEGLGTMQVSRVRRNYKQENRTLKIEIVDTTMAAVMRAPFALAQAMNVDSDRGWKKGMTIGGYPGVLEWRKRYNTSNAQVLVADRFLVRVRATPASSPDEASSVAAGLDLKGLAAAK